MVKVDFESFVSKVDEFFTQSKTKNSLLFSFKRQYTENFKYKSNTKMRRMRQKDKLKQEENPNQEYNLICRVKLRRKRVQCTVQPKDLIRFQNILMKIFSLHFINNKNENMKNKSEIVKVKSKTQRRKEKRLKKLSFKAMTTQNKDGNEKEEENK